MAAFDLPLRGAARAIGRSGAARRTLEVATSCAAIVVLAAVVVRPWIAEMAMPAPSEPAVPVQSSGAAGDGSQLRKGREILIAGYVSQPFYARSDVHMTRRDGTDVTLKKLGWDGDALYFPIDGGIRSVEWFGPLGVMIDFLHNKAVSRLGKGAHGRMIENGIIEDVAAEGTLAGAPAPARIKLTDLFERLEFTHGHNVLIFTPLLKLGAITPKVRPYIGAGAGFALPHVEVWFPKGKRGDRTSEYQLAGPAAQVVAGLDIRIGRVSYFLEYKFSWASISASLTGDESWLDFMMPGDLWRQARRWWAGEEPAIGRLSTTLSAHQVAGGAGYWFGGAPKAP